MIGNVPSDQFLEDQRVLLEEDNESLPSSSLSLALPLVFTRQQKTDRKRVFGSECMEPAELDKALCGSSSSLAGANQRSPSKTTLVAHSTSDLETRAFFPRPGSQISMSGVN